MRPNPVEVAKIVFVLEEKLSDGAHGAGIDLRLQHVEVGFDGGTFRMFLRIGGNRDLDIRDAANAGNEVGGMAIALGMGRLALAYSAGWITAQRYDVTHAGLAIIADDLIDLIPGGGHAGQMRGRNQRGLV